MIRRGRLITWWHYRKCAAAALALRMSTLQLSEPTLITRIYCRVLSTAMVEVGKWEREHRIALKKKVPARTSPGVKSES